MSAITDTYLRASQASFRAEMRAVAADSRWFTVQPTAPKPRDYNAEAQAEVDAICTSLSDQAAP